MGVYVVTGAAGFIGSRVSAFLLNEGHIVWGVDNLNHVYDVRMKEHRLSKLINRENFHFLKEDIADNLTTPEFTIAMLANRGWTNAEIADYMDMTLRTVKQHLSSIFNKLNIDSRGQLKAYMLK